MKLEVSYKRIWSISAPLMIGSAVQNVIALSDSIFLYHRDEADFAAIGFVGVFYLIIAAIGYGFSKGGQIMIARRMGEGRARWVGRTFYAMLYFELILAVLMFLVMKFGCPLIFPLFVDSEIVLTKSLEYLDYRAYGVFFSYTGLAMIALYTGVARTSFIIIDTLLLAIINIVLNWGLIFGNYGLPEMGISGAALASTIAEIVAMLTFVLYMVFGDKEAKRYYLFTPTRFDWWLVMQQLRIAAPVVAQNVIGMGSWFVFFSMIENLGPRPLAISNLARIVYLILSVPAWGFASGTNTLVSNLMGQVSHDRVMPALHKTAKLCLISTLILSIPVLFYPKFFLYPLLGGGDMSLIDEARPVFFVVLAILAIFSIGSVYFNGLIGTGATLVSLRMQAVSAILYLIFINVAINYYPHNLPLAWCSELLYWLFLTIASLWFLRRPSWRRISV